MNRKQGLFNNQIKLNQHMLFQFFTQTIEYQYFKIYIQFVKHQDSVN